jgi:hypothetical protein
MTHSPFVRLMLQQRRERPNAFDIDRWRGLHRRLAWRYGDASARVEAMEADIAKWRGLGR